jgi:hypothetical protein
MRWFKYFVDGAVYRVIKTFTLAPSPIAVLAANSPTVPAPKITTSVGTPFMLPNSNPFQIH